MQLKSLDERNNELRNMVSIQFGAIHDQITKEDIIDWFSKLCTFKPTRMHTINKSQRYKASEWKERIRSCGNDYGSYYLENPSDFYVRCYYNSTGSFRALIPLDVWEQQKEDLLYFLDDFFVRINGCFGFVDNHFDKNVVQNLPFYGSYKNAFDYCYSWKLDDSDFPGIGIIPWIPHPNFPMTFLPDPSYLPGHNYSYENVIFSVSPYMWTGPDIFDVIPNDRLEAFAECEENVEFAPEFRRICLRENLLEYNHPTYRKRQWAFREACDWEAAMKNLKKNFSVKERPNDTQHEMIELKTGNFPNGGTLLARYYVDKHGKPCEKREAYAYIEREMKGHTILSQQRKKIDRN